jgi:hypothetical protein
MCSAEQVAWSASPAEHDDPVVRLAPCTRATDELVAAGGVAVGGAAREGEDLPVLVEGILST